MNGQFTLPLEAPRTGNTGALVSCSAQLDCLEFSLFGVSWQRVSEKFLRLSPKQFERCSVGLRGYPCRVRRGHVQILFAASCENKPVKALISGQGLAEIGVDHLELLRHVLRHNAGCGQSLKTCVTQLHLAIDDRSGGITSDRIASAVADGLAVTRFRGVQNIRGFDLGAGGVPDYKGETWYFGSFGSDRLLRCYDKQAERISAGEEDPGPWYRFELQSRRKYAQKLAETLVCEGLESSGGILRGVLDFREKDNENETRRTPCAWFAVFCDGLEAIKTGVSKSPECLRKTLEWLSRGVSRRLAECRSVLGDRWLSELLRIGEEKIDQGRVAALSEQADQEGITGPRGVLELCTFAPF